MMNALKNAQERNHLNETSIFRNVSMRLDQHEFKTRKIIKTQATTREYRDKLPRKRSGNCKLNTPGIVENTVSLIADTLCINWSLGNWNILSCLGWKSGTLSTAKNFRSSFAKLFDTFWSNWNLRSCDILVCFELECCNLPMVVEFWLLEMGAPCTAIARAMIAVKRFWENGIFEKENSEILKG
jgi:hypothetical protein